MNPRDAVRALKNSRATTWHIYLPGVDCSMDFGSALCGWAEYRIEEGISLNSSLDLLLMRSVTPHDVGVHGCLECFIQADVLLAVDAYERARALTAYRLVVGGDGDCGQCGWRIDKKGAGTHIRVGGLCYACAYAISVDSVARNLGLQFSEL